MGTKTNNKHNAYQQHYKTQTADILPPKWEQILTTNTNIKDKQQLTNILSSKQTMNIAINRGAITATRFFGFVITNDATIIATERGFIERADLF